MTDFAILCYVATCFKCFLYSGVISVYAHSLHRSPTLHQTAKSYHKRTECTRYQTENQH